MSLNDTLTVRVKSMVMPLPSLMQVGWGKFYQNNLEYMDKPHKSS